MGYEIHLGKFSDDLETEIPISKQEWIECSKQVKDVKWLEEEQTASILAYSEERQDWVPVFWVHKGIGSMKAKGFFNNDVSYPKAYEIADFLNAFIYGDEGEIYFLPGYGILYDNESHQKGHTITLEELKTFTSTYGSDYKKILQTVNEKYNKAEKQQNQRIWWIISIIMIGFVLLYLFLS